MTDREIEEKAIEHYGKCDQIIKSVEELSELITALTRYINNYDPDNLANIFEELADVEIMTEQLKMIFDCVEEVKDIRYFKLHGLEERMNNG